MRVGICIWQLTIGQISLVSITGKRKRKKLLYEKTYILEYILHFSHVLFIMNSNGNFDDGGL